MVKNPENSISNAGLTEQEKQSSSSMPHPKSSGNATWVAPKALAVAPNLAGQPNSKSHETIIPLAIDIAIAFNIAANGDVDAEVKVDVKIVVVHVLDAIVLASPSAKNFLVSCRQPSRRHLRTLVHASNTRLLIETLS